MSDDILKIARDEGVGIGPEAALRICSKGAPLKRAQEVLKDLVSWARTGPSRRESSPESLMHSTSHREMVSLEAAL